LRSHDKEIQGVDGHRIIYRMTTAMQDEELQAAMAKYAEDFGSKAAAQLLGYARRHQAQNSR
jgi:hypothetical protein